MSGSGSKQLSLDTLIVYLKDFFFLKSSILNKADDKKNVINCPGCKKLWFLLILHSKTLAFLMIHGTDRIYPPAIALILIALYFVTGGEHINMCQWAWPADNW